MADVAKKETVTIILFVLTLAVLVFGVLTVLSFENTRIEGCNNDFVCDEENRREATTYRCFPPANWDCCEDDSGNFVDCGEVKDTGYSTYASAIASQCNPEAFITPLCRNNNWCNIKESCLTDGNYKLIANSCIDDDDCSEISECSEGDCFCDADGVNLCFFSDGETRLAVQTCELTTECSELFDCQNSDNECFCDSEDQCVIDCGIEKDVCEALCLDNTDCEKDCVEDEGICIEDCTLRGYTNICNYEKPGDCWCPEVSICQLAEFGSECLCRNNLTNKCKIIDGQYVCECQ